MRHLGGYTWETILNEEFVRTMITIQLLNKEKKEEEKAMKKRGKR